MTRGLLVVLAALPFAIFKLTPLYGDLVQLSALAFFVICLATALALQIAFRLTSAE